ncbi:agmatine deiminase family protein [Variovorax sp. ZS18.2.2]|uniref:agmatine deiminase family protein n=1 Tax=Variovorax sp. ZS18.2.2 TaxID=2971255 RepID=UPI00215131AB|nr:agmatine deiminase family protein [Variovorax sp. ZS18.2.2]MCR6478187.1 agmatine deiminase family protein [Variovorax sp. ZS18.2.2]
MISNDFDARRAGLRMPAEWEPMAATWLGWPVLENREALWGAHYESVCQAFGLLARTIARYQRCIVATHAPLAGDARAICGPNVTVVPIAAEDNWLRDCGPIFLVDEDRVTQTAVGFRFNAWGEKYQPHDGCQRAAADIAALAQVPLVESEMVLEGGAFYVDGQGTLLTTESCLLHVNRNPGMRKPDIEAELRRMLGVRKIVWLPGHAAEVETDGHVDGIASFIAPGRVLFNTADPDQGDYHRAMQENRRALELATDAQGRRFEILDLPVPRQVQNHGSARFCDIYSNYILVNGAVISTAFDVPRDAEAREVFGRAFPDRRIELLPIGAISLGGGAAHCSTQQQPMLGNRLAVRAF